MSLDKAAVREMRDKIQAALDKLDLGFQMKLGNASFIGDCCTFKLETSIIGKDGTVKTKMAQDFESFASIYQLKATDLNRSFTDDAGVRWKIVGALPRSRKAPIVCENGNGKQYKLPLLRVQIGLQRESSATS